MIKTESISPVYQSYNPPWWLKNGHLQSIYPSLFRRVLLPSLQRERIFTKDDDFLDLDWLKAKKPRKQLVILSHGLEGHSRRPYMLGMAQAAMSRGFDALLWNFRSCSGEINRQFGMYHSGQIDDLALVVEHALLQGYEELALIGFSIGGNKTLRYLSLSSALVAQLKCAVAFSVPVDLKAGAEHLARPVNALYMKNFLHSFKPKLEQKAAQFPERVNLDGFEKIKSFAEFDSRYTAPMNGFSSAEQYWQESSSKPHIIKIQRPTLLLSALDDPFLPSACYPYTEAAANDLVFFEAPRHGGHVGFMPSKGSESYYSEQRAMAFISQYFS